MSLIDPRLLAILRCPVCHEDVAEDVDALVCPQGHRYPVVDGIPDMVPGDDS
jgi:uncharacterized protein YbaR (Trm112 family)